MKAILFLALFSNPGRATETLDAYDRINRMQWKLGAFESILLDKEGKAKPNPLLEISEKDGRIDAVLKGKDPRDRAQIRMRVERNTDKSVGRVLFVEGLLDKAFTGKFNANGKLVSATFCKVRTLDEQNVDYCVTASAQACAKLMRYAGVHRMTDLSTRVGWCGAMTDIVLDDGDAKIRDENVDAMRSFIGSKQKFVNGKSTVSLPESNQAAKALLGSFGLLKIMGDLCELDYKAAGGEPDWDPAARSHDKDSK